MKKTNLILFLFMIVLVGGVMAKTTMNFLTKGFADSLYCPIDGTCINISDLIINVTIDVTQLLNEYWVNESGEPNLDLVLRTVNASWNGSIEYTKTTDLAYTGNCSISGSCAPTIAYMDYSNLGNFTVDNPTFHIDSTNNRVGIGTASPQSALHIATNVGSGVKLERGTLDARWWGASNGPAYFGTISNDALNFQTNNNNRMTIASGLTGGAVDVVGDFTAGTVTSDGNIGGVNAIFTGNVGIGTTSPDYKLKIAGTASTDMASSEIGFDLDYVEPPTIGQWSLALIEGVGNLSIGEYTYYTEYVTALGETGRSDRKRITTNSTHTKVNITLPVSPDHRVTGRKVFRNGVDGNEWEIRNITFIDDNTQTNYIDNTNDTNLGDDTVYFSPDTTNKGITKDGVTVFVADYNVLILGAGGAGNPASATGGRSTYIGYGAGDDVTTANDNTIIGYAAGTSLTTHGTNTMIGTYSGLGATCTTTTAVGQMSARNFGGFRSTFIGVQAGANSASGQTGQYYNVGVGEEALQNIASNAYRNVAIGWRAGEGGISGDDNVLLGAETGQIITTGSRNIIIGRNIDPPANDTNDFLNIGDTIYGDLSTGNIGIGTTTPNEKLTVIGSVNVTENLVVGGNLTYKTIYAQLSDLVDQSFGTANTKQPINLTTTDESYGIDISVYNITIQKSGVYDIAAQPQVATGAGGAGKFHMWLEKHDTTEWVNVSNSNVELVLANNEENVIPLIDTLMLNAGEKIRVMGSVSDTAIILDAQSPTGEPNIPSIIFRIFRLGN